MKSTIRLVIVAVGIGNITGAACAAGPTPNVVLIIGDDQGWTDYSFMGHPRYPAPFRAAFAAS